MTTNPRLDFINIYLLEMESFGDNQKSYELCKELASSPVINDVILSAIEDNVSIEEFSKEFSSRINRPQNEVQELILDIILYWKILFKEKENNE